MRGLQSAVRDPIRSVMRGIARFINAMTGGKLHPNAVTLFGLFMHLPVAALIATRHYIWAAIFLVIFGLFDTLDGELARLQKRASHLGMFLDASTDRFKEVMLYTGAAFALVATGQEYWAVWAVVACGASLSVSYVKAKGEAAVASKDIPHATLNRMFADGLLTFEMRMFVLVVGLLVNQLAWALVLVAVLASYTAIKRLIVIGKQL